MATPHKRKRTNDGIDETGTSKVRRLDADEKTMTRLRNSRFAGATHRISIGKVHDAHLHIMLDGKECVVVSFLHSYTQYLRCVCNENTYCGDGVYRVDADDLCIDYIFSCVELCYKTSIAGTTIYPSDFLQLVIFMEKCGMLLSDIKHVINDIFPAIIRGTPHFDECFITLIDSGLTGLKSFLIAAVWSLVHRDCTYMQMIDEHSQVAGVLRRLAEEFEITATTYPAILTELRRREITRKNISAAVAAL